MIRKLLRPLRALVFWRRLDRDIQRELDFHIAMESDRRARGGLPAAEARRAAPRFAISVASAGSRKRSAIPAA